MYSEQYVLLRSYRITHLLASPGTVEKWDETMSVNLRSVMLSYRYAAMQMIKQGRGGRIIGEYQVIFYVSTVQLIIMSATKRRIVIRWQTR